MNQFSIKLRGVRGPFTILAPYSTHLDFITALITSRNANGGLVTLQTSVSISPKDRDEAERGANFITIHLDAIEAINGPNKPFPAAFGEWVFL